MASTNESRFVKLHFLNLWLVFKKSLSFFAIFPSLMCTREVKKVIQYILRTVNEDWRSLVNLFYGLPRICFSLTHDLKLHMGLKIPGRPLRWPAKDSFSLIHDLKLHMGLKNVVDMRIFYEDWFVKSNFLNRTPSRFEAHLVYNHTPKPYLWISNAR